MYFSLCRDHPSYIVVIPQSPGAVSVLMICNLSSRRLKAVGKAPFLSEDFVSSFPSWTRGRGGKLIVSNERPRGKRQGC
jgi:hypothetical protein